MGVAWINVKDKGATGDGSTNDIAAFEDALDDLSNGGVLYVPPGTYMLGTRAFEIDTNNIQIIGDGPEATILKHKDATGHVLIYVKATSPNTRDNFRIANLTLDGNISVITTGSTNVLNLERVKNFSIENVIIKNGKKDNLYINGDNDGTEVLTNGIVRDCYFSGAGDNNLDIGKNSIRVVISDSYFGSTDTDKTSITIGGSSHYITIKNCFIESAGSNGINVAETNSTNAYHIFENNNIKDCGTQGILATKANRIRISGNSIINSGKNGINTDSCTECIIEGNLCFNSNGSDDYDACGILVGGDSETLELIPEIVTT